MTGFVRRPLAVFVCCLFAAVPALHAAPETDVLLLAASSVRQKPEVVPMVSVEPLDDAWPMYLRSERRFNVMGRKKQPLVPGVGVPYPVEPVKDVAYPLFVVAAQQMTISTNATEGYQVFLRSNDSMRSIFAI